MHNISILDGNRQITFLTSAIRFYIEKDKVHHIMLGDRHCDIIKQIAENGFTSDYKKTHTDGFLCKVSSKKYDDQILFISREIATEIAKKANYPLIGYMLTSEDLW